MLETKDLHNDTVRGKESVGIYESLKCHIFVKMTMKYCYNMKYNFHPQKYKSITQ